jgi:PRTRC genetic system protein B
MVSRSDSRIQAIGAIIAYGREDGGFMQGHDQETAQFATLHKIESINGVPQIMPGRPITERDLAGLHKGLSAQHAGQMISWLDQKMLGRGPDRMVWWTPPTKRPMFFQASSFNKKTFTGSAVCPVPGLVWMAAPSDGLYVFAISGAERPTPETELYQAPFFNVWGRGKICAGNAHKPPEEQMWNTDAWEGFFFGSTFTHANFSEKDRLVKGKDPATFWKAMINAPAETFPENRLCPMPLTAGDLVDPLIIDRLTALPKPKGEF